ncbi:MAG TPA: DUF4391 domain-containing protein [Methanosarcina sp.]|nr:DUF4391 domain-containing protein [Methanosarcina sp.]
MNEILLSKLGFPDSTYLGTRVFKKLFFENAALTATDKKSLKEDVETIIWQYTLKPSTIQIKAYTDVQREYLEVAVLEITLRSPRNYKRLAEVIHRAIPYPMLLTFAQNPEKSSKEPDDNDNEKHEDMHKDTESKVALSVAPKRFSQAEKGAVVVEEFFTTGWIDLEKISDIEQAFLDTLNLSNLPHTHFLAFYSALMDRFIALDCASLTGKYRLNNEEISQEARRQQLTVCHELEGKIAKLRATLHKQDQFNRKVELNVQIKQLEKQLQKESLSL